MLKLFDKEAKRRYGAGCKVGVFLDYVSMPQRSRGSPEDDRTPEELATFKRSLQVRRRRPVPPCHTARLPPPRCLPLERRRRADAPPPPRLPAPAAAGKLETTAWSVQHRTDRK